MHIRGMVGSVVPGVNFLGWPGAPACVFYALVPACLDMSIVVDQAM